MKSMCASKHWLVDVGILALISVSFLAGTLAPIAMTQPSDPKYVRIDYMKVDPYKTNSYLKMEREIWKPIHQQLVNDGKIRSWSLYEVRFPQGDNLEYGYLTFTIFNKFQDLETENDFTVFTDVLKKVHPKRTPAALEVNTLDNRKLVRSEVWKLVDNTR
jgi:hypothetical protein